MMRLAEEPRAADRTILLRLYNGNPPFDESTEEENNIQVNRNDLSGPSLMANAYRQWNQNFLKGPKFFTGRPDIGPAHKRSGWSADFTKNANRLLKRSQRMRGQIRGTGKNTLTFGLGPTMWNTRRGVVPKTVPVGSLLLPSETEVEDWENDVSYFAVFREWTPTMLYEMTHGPRVDPGWNMKLVQSQMDYLKEQLYKSPNSLAYQYMPERIEELIKQDKGYLGSDAVPTCDAWDFYFRESEEDGHGWYRRIILDWNYGSQGSKRGDSRNMVDGKTQFLYTSGKRKYANSINEILHCQFGDLSPYAPSKYHDMRGLGWMLWGVCDIQNQQWCKFNEAVFEQYMWFFQTAGNQDLMRIKKANFEHMGLIPQGIRWLTPNERYIPNLPLIELAFDLNRRRMAEASTSFTQDFQRQSKNDMTATETMAIVNASQSLANAVFENAATEEETKYREICRRLCLKNSTDPMAREFRLACLKDGIPEDMLDVNKWTIEAERVIGGGNKTVQMAAVGFLNTIRKNVPPAGQRLIDNISVEAATDQPDLAQEIAPVGEDTPISGSMHDAQLATQRIMAGLDFKAPKDAVYEDYVTTWIVDLGNIIKKTFALGGMPSPSDFVGMNALLQKTTEFLQVMGQNEDDKDKVRQYQDALNQLANHIKAFGQRMQQQQGAQGGGNGNEKAAETQAKIKAELIKAKAKADNTRESHAQRTQQRQQSWEMEERRKDLQARGQIQREGVITRHQLMADRLKALSE